MSSETAERNLTKLDRRQVLINIIIISMCFILKRGTKVHNCDPVCRLYIDYYATMIEFRGLQLLALYIDYYATMIEFRGFQLLACVSLSMAQKL